MNANAKILMIDDDADVRATICENLRESGYQVLEAANGLHGLAMIEAYNPALVITDIVMPEMGGYEVIEEVKKTRPDIKIIAISGGARLEQSDFFETARAAGATAAFSKPIDLDRLEMTIRQTFS